MRNLAILTALLALAPLARAQEAQSITNPEVKEFYDKAFTFYVDGDYQKAIEHWNMVLREDPEQTTARTMIEEARRKMAGTSSELKASFRRFVESGKYSEALLKLEALLATDPTNPYYGRVSARLRRISALAPSRRGTKAWNAAVEGISAWLGEDEDLSFAYDALRYAHELDRSEKAFPGMVAFLESESPQLKLNDTKPDNIPILEHKKEKALHQIYDSKFYLAVKELEDVLRLNPRDLTALKRAGSAYLKLKNYTKARSAWQRALRLSPKDEQLPQYLEALDKMTPRGRRKG